MTLLPAMPTWAASSALAPTVDAVRNLHEVVDLRPALDPGLANRRPIDRRVGANLDVVFDDHGGDLRDLLVRPVVAVRKAEAVAAHDRAVLDDAPRADDDALPDRDARVQQAVRPERRAAARRRLCA